MRSSRPVVLQLAAVLLPLLLPLLLVPLADASSVGQVQVTLEPLWSSSSVIQEASEFFWKRSPTHFWWFIGNATKGDWFSLSDKALVERVGESGFCSAVNVPLLEFALSVQAFSPLIEMNRQLLAQEASVDDVCGRPTASFVAIAGDRSVCELAALTALAEAAAPARADRMFTLDEHEFQPCSRAGDATAPLVILYADLGRADAFRAHGILAAGAAEGRWRYIFRHKGGAPESGRRMLLSGYGVELAIKNMEYRAVDDSHASAAAAPEPAPEPAPAQAEDEEAVAGATAASAAAVDAELAELAALSTAELAPVPEAKIGDLGLLAAQRILRAAAPGRVLVELAHNFPSLAPGLARGTVDKTLAAAFSAQASAIGVGYNMLAVNGQSVAADTASPFQLLEVVLAEVAMHDSLTALGLRGHEITSLMQTPLSGGGGRASQHPGGGLPKPVAKVSIVDLIAAGAVAFANDLRRDGQYTRWAPSVQSIAYTPPGQFAYVRANMVSFVAFCDGADVDCLVTASLLSQFHMRSAPARLGMMLRVPEFASLFVGGARPAFDASNPAHRASSASGLLALAAHWAVQAGAPHLVSELLVSTGTASNWASADVAAVAAGFSQVQLPATLAGMTLDALRADDELAAALFTAQAAVAGKALPLGAFVGNALVFTETTAQPALIAALSAELDVFRAAVASGAVTDSTDLLGWASSQADVMDAYSALAMPSTARPLAMVPLAASTALRGAMQWLPCAGLEVGVIPHVSLVLAAPLGVPAGRAAARAALALLPRCSDAQLAIVDSSARGGAAAAAAAAAVLDDRLSGQQRLALVTALAAADWDGNALAALASAGVTNAAEVLADGESSAARLSRWAAETLGTGSESAAAVLVNARRVALSLPDDVLGAADLEVMVAHERSERADRILPIIENADFADVPADGKTPAFYSAVLSSVVSVLAEPKRMDAAASRLKLPANFDSLVRRTSFALPRRSGPDAPAAAVSVLAVLDPLSPAAQRLAPLLVALAAQMDLHVRIVLSPVPGLSAVPLRRYYRYALSPLSFGASGRRWDGPRVVFAGVPRESTLTLGMETPDSWLVTSTAAKYDLDNIKLADAAAAGEGVDAVFVLESLLAEGSCHNAEDHSPAKGLQLVLGTASSPDARGDTVVMENLGYWQLKAAPGVWRLALKPGRSADLFQLLVPGSATASESADSLPVVVGDFTGSMLSLQARRVPGRESIPLLQEGDGFWSSVSAWVGGAAHGKAGKTVHVFSLASGHLYERFLKIMTVSVTNHTAAPVKFWFVSNFLSPQFKEQLPALAAAHGYDYELVTYRWPRWLNAQTEKQRIIWAYKILFLDVLFPQDLDRVIFVDADQIVRADLSELMEMDLQGAPYGFTPFCNSNPTTSGFRFWESGFWANHLRGRPYHISALFVVDLKRLRLVAGADQLRGNYHSLSQDPNSLANLDQDLPNYLQNQLPIFSLPQEWLWCETWCDERSKAKAKTIDLCNNPLTKTPKLENAKRIVPEWIGYDNQVKAVEARAAEARAEALRTKGEL